MLLHKFRHVDANQRVFTIKQRERQRFTQLSFTHTCRAKKHK